MEQPSLKALAISPGKLSPGFSPGRRQYTVYVTHSVAEVALTAETGTPGAALRVNGVPAARVRRANPGRSAVPSPLTMTYGVRAAGAAEATDTAKSGSWISTRAPLSART